MNERAKKTLMVIGIIIAAVLLLTVFRRVLALAFALLSMKVVLIALIVLIVLFLLRQPAK
jgi:uncharacterized membrane protein YdfJ with MMPL/SSD domain